MPALYTQPSPNPTRKVTAGALGGALAAIVAWAVQAFGDVVLPPGIEAAIAVVFSFLCSYITQDEAASPVEVTVTNTPSEPVPVVGEVERPFGPATSDG
jgi:hypothetical protein